MPGKRYTAADRDPFATSRCASCISCCAPVAFPGGFGTFDELFETLTLVQTRKIAPENRSSPRLR